MAYSPTKFILNERASNILGEELQIVSKEKIKGLSKSDLNLLTKVKDEMSTKKSEEIQLAYENYQKLVDESLLKMRFLRLELLTLLNQKENKKMKLTSDLKSEKSNLEKTNTMSFKTNSEDLWADEIYKSETSLNNNCEAINE
jgi:hypothetical protein